MMKAFEYRPLICRGIDECGNGRTISVFSRRKTLNPCLAIITCHRKHTVPAYILHRYPTITHVLATSSDGQSLLLDATRRGEIHLGTNINADAPNRFDGNYYWLPEAYDKPFGVKL